nr:MAG TPA: hypothetical protein [Caudoviricetes sp.]
MNNSKTQDDVQKHNQWQFLIVKLKTIWGLHCKRGFSRVEPISPIPHQHL